jgi:hypothetical protein
MDEPAILSLAWPSPQQIRVLQVRAAMRGHQTRPHPEPDMRRFVYCDRCRLSIGMLNIQNGWTEVCRG